jgi:hypothetical protein
LETIVETNVVVKENPSNPALSRQHQPDGFLRYAGYAFVLVSVSCFAAIAYLKLQQSLGGKSLAHTLNWIEMAEQENATISLLIIAVIAAMLGKGLQQSVQTDSATTIPYHDLELVRQAVIEGRPDPIDQYVRLRALTGMAGNFTKLGVTGLPLTTVFLTLIFSVISLLSVNGTSSAFLDLAKLTLGAFIGSFVQGRVDQRRSGDSREPNNRRRSDVIA